MKVKIFALNDEANVQKLQSYGAEVIDVMPQEDDVSMYVVEVADDKVEELVQKLFGMSKEEALDNGDIEIEANVEEEQKIANEVQNEAIDEVEDMYEEGRDVINASATTTWSAADGFTADEDSDVEVVDTHNGKLLLSDGYVLGYLHEDSAEESVADLFANNEQLAETIKTALLTEASAAEALASFGFEPYSIELDEEESTELAAKARVEEVKASFNETEKNLKASVEQSLAMALLATFKGFDGKACPVKAALADALEEEGAENAEEFVEEKLEDTIPDVVEAVCSKAYEFMAKDDNVRDELAKSIEEAPYAKLDRSMQHKDC